MEQQATNYDIAYPMRQRQKAPPITTCISAGKRETSADEKPPSHLRLVVDDTLPTVFIQRFGYPGHAFLVFRKPERADEQFVLSPGATLDPHRLWAVSPLLFASREKLQAIEEYLLVTEGDVEGNFSLERVALIYLEADNPPVSDERELPDASPLVAIMYDSDVTQLRYSFEAYELPEWRSTATYKFDLDAEFQDDPEDLFDELEDEFEDKFTDTLDEAIAYAVAALHERFNQ